MGKTGNKPALWGHPSVRQRLPGSAGLCSKTRVLCFRASPVKLEYYAQNYARLEPVLCLNYAGLKWHFHTNVPTPP